MGHIEDFYRNAQAPPPVVTSDPRRYREMIAKVSGSVPSKDENGRIVELLDAC
jgi:hypothetical protein